MMFRRLASWFRFYTTPTTHASSSTQQADLMLALSHALKEMDIETIDALLQSGLDITRRNERGYGIVHMAVLNANEKSEPRMLSIIELLVNRGADVNAYYVKDQYGPLTTAVRRKLPLIVSYLLAQGADSNLKSLPHYKTALDYAREFSDERGKKVLACFDQQLCLEKENNFTHS